MLLTSVIEPYSDYWPLRYSEAAAWLRPLFGGVLEDLHHVGSTAVEGLSAKPEIDILALVAQVPDDSWEIPLAAHGFQRGGNLSANHLFFKRNENGVRSHKLHVCIAAHPTAIEMLWFRDHLRQCHADRDQYAELKLRLQAQNTLGIREYLQRKTPFIRAILDKMVVP